jgi:photosystem II stability/assembly factor-like uncharacterized protein
MTLFAVNVFLPFLLKEPTLSANSIQQSSSESNSLYYLPIFVRQSFNATWLPLGFANEKVTDLYLDPELPGHVFVTVLLAGVYETYDGGDIWIRHSDVSSRAFDIAVHPITPETMYLATWSSYGMYWTQNGGETWEGIPGWSSLSPQLYSVAVHPLTPTLMLAGSGNFEPIGGEIFKTTNGGQSWYIVSPMFTNAVTFAFDPVSPSIVYAGTKLSGVRKSMDAGNTWYIANTGLPTGTGEVRDTHVILHPDSSQKVYAATSSGVYMSVDEAENWQGLWEGVDANFLLFDPQNPSTVYLGADDGIYVSYDTGVSWFPVGQCGAGTSVTRLAFDPYDTNVIWAGTTNGLWQCIL